DGLGLLSVFGFRGYRLIAVIHRAVLIIHVLAIVVVNGIGPAVIDPSRQWRPCGRSPVTEAGVVRPVDVIVVPPAVAIPIAEVAAVVLPIVANVVAMFVAPILPLASVGNSIREVLYMITRSSWATDV